MQNEHLPRTRAASSSSSPTPFSDMDAAVSYETRELVWELSQERTDGQRIQFLLDTGADLAAALALADIPAQQVLTDPKLRRLNLRRYLK